MTSSPALLAADWGTTNFRLFLYDADGKVVARHTAHIGLKNLGGQSFEQALQSVMTGPFARPDLPVLLSGMVGSRQGWIEAPYAQCPAGPDAFSQGFATPPSEKLKVRIVPGLSSQNPATGITDVMRGEETQIVGLMTQGLNDGIVILPGTHSKWARIENGKVTSFLSYMTGEMFQMLKVHSILGVLMADTADDEKSFLLGVDRALEDTSILSLLFSVRTEALFGRIAPAHLSSYLSGLLIGAEIGAGKARNGLQSVGIIGDGALINLYQRALSRAGFTDVTRHNGDDASSAGLWELAQQGHLL
jgi:2-dehydro-3-deoxygalactonokinase